jgi:glycosyltransferase involved in cell wall biosynthesis
MAGQRDQPPLRVAMDVTALLDRPTGVGVVTGHLLAGLHARPDLVLRAFALTWRGRRAAPAAVPAGVPVVRRPAPARPLRAAWKRLDLPPVECWTGPVDVVHGPNFVVPPARRAAEVVTVHDLTCVRYPELCTPDTLAYPRLLQRALRRGAWVHAVSQFVADEVVEVLGAAPDRVVAIPNGAPAPVVGRADRGRRLAGLPPDPNGSDGYVLALGTVEPRKDLVSLVRAFTRLADRHPGLHLVVAGPDGWGADALADAVFRCADGTRRRIRRLGWVSDEERADLLVGARVVAYPSVYEGFGLVPLEAMAAGVPVVTTAAGAIPEVVGDAAEVVPVGDVEALAGAIDAVVGDPEHRARLRRRGHDRLLAFSWERATADLAALYHRAADDRR